MNGATVELVLLLVVVLLFLLYSVWGCGEGGRGEGGGTKLHLEGLNKAQHFEGELAALVEQTLQTGTQQQQQQQPSTHSLHKRFQVNYFLGYCILQFCSVKLHFKCYSLKVHFNFHSLIFLYSIKRSAWCWFVPVLAAEFVRGDLLTHSAVELRAEERHAEAQLQRNPLALPGERWRTKERHHTHKNIMHGTDESTMTIRMIWYTSNVLLRYLGPKNVIY